MSLIRFSTEVLPERDRVPLFQDLVARRFINAEMRILTEGPRPFFFTMGLAAGERIRVAEVDFAAVAVWRKQRYLADYDDGVTCFIPRGTPVPTDHRDHRRVMREGDAVLVGHRQEGRSRWSDNHVTVIMVPRAALADPDAVDAAAGLVHARNRPVLKLLRAYLRSVWAGLEETGGLTPEADANVVALIEGMAAASPEGMRRAAWPALGPARVAAMREIILRRAGEPGLGMAEVAAGVGLSERSGHLVLAAAELRFSEVLAETRLRRVCERLRQGGPGRIIDIAFDAGFGDIAHFNRLFRRRYAMTPTEMRRRRGDDGDASPEGEEPLDVVGHAR